MKRPFVILLFLAGLLPAGAQSLRLTPYTAPTALYADIDRLLNYNLHEHVRIEAGLTWVLPSESARDPKVFLGQWTLRGYAAYGVYDRAFKYGGSVQLRLPGSSDVRLRLSLKDDLERTGSRSFESYKMTSISLNNGYVASLFSHVQALEGKVIWKPFSRWEAAVGMRYSREAVVQHDTTFPYAHYAEASARVDFDGRLTVELRTGMTDNPSIHPSDNPTIRQSFYLRALAQYSYGEMDEDLHLWAQAGYTTPEAPESRQFDISGTGRTPCYFEHTLLTVPPRSFMADMFAHVLVKYTAPLPLWKTSFSSPKPFLQLNARWGHTPDYHLFIAEPATGFDGILRWGLLDMGVATAYQLTPPNAPYRPQDLRNGIAFAIVARLIV